MLYFQHSTNQPPREHVRNRNIRLLATNNPNVSQDGLEAVEARLTDQILRAMSQEHLEISIPAHIRDPQGLQDEVRRRVEEKRLTQAKLRPLLGSLVGGPFSLLRRIVAPDLAQPTNLETKLIAGGVPKVIIDQAKSIRANAAIRENEIAASQLFDIQDRLDDVHQRIEILASAVAARFDERSNPARHIWGELQKLLQEQAKEVDPNMVYKRDPFLLLGAACGLSDECRIEWGCQLHKELFQPTLEGEARLLLLINAFTSNTKSLEGRTKLAKLDFLLRYPHFLVRALSIRRPNLTAEIAPQEQMNIENRMIRYCYGPWDPAYYAILGRLIGRGLVQTVPTTNGIGYRTTQTGRSVAES